LLLRRFAVTRVAFGIKMTRPTHYVELPVFNQELGPDPISAECGNRPSRAQ